jgi:carnitine O-acetyltransferase
MESTFSLQDTLAKSPMPSLQSSCDKLLGWTAPLLSQQEWLRTKELVTQFTSPDGEGVKLQNSLENGANNKNILNWTAPVWLDSYLTARYSLVINSNVFYYLKSKLSREIFSQGQIATALVRCIFEFKLLIDNGELSVDRQKGQPICMAQYKHLFSATRIPKKGKDELAITTAKKHIIVLFKAHIFKLDIVNEQGDIYSFSEIEAALKKIMATTEQGQNFGVLTTMERDAWAESRITLLNNNQKNQAQIKQIEEAVFALCLDENSPDSLVDTSQMLLHGDGSNRFFDKSLQFIVFKNGKTGVNFEHTGMDGAVMLRLIGHIYDNIDKYTLNEEAASVIVPEPLTFDLSSELTATLQNASKDFYLAVNNTQTRVLNFSQFGKNQVKKFNMSPDAFLQVALQLAEYKLYGKCYSAYEAIMTRSFLQGRIDVLYTVSAESMAFIKNINDVNCDKHTIIASLRKATEKHITRANECRLGHGIHTHFLGLISRFQAEGEQMGMTTLPNIFTDNGYQTLTHSVVCTSTTAEYGVELAGYGPVVEDGYDIRYFTRADSICFNITRRTAIKDNLDLMVQYIELSLVEMAELMRNL